MRWTEEEYEQHMKKKGTPTNQTFSSQSSTPKPSKKGNKKCEMDGYKFDSMKEMKRYNQLKILQRAGQIQNLKLQPTFILQPSFKKNGKTFIMIKYIADFLYEVNGKTIVEDVKASEKFMDDVYLLKKKIFEYKYPDLSIIEVFKV